MKPILIIVPHEKIECVAKTVSAHYDDVDVEFGLLKDSIEIVKRAEIEGVEAIISRGGTAKMIIENFPNMPVVEMPVSPYDMISAIYNAKRYGRDVYVLGFDNIIRGVENLESILDINIHSYLIQSEEDGEAYISSIIGSGARIDALLGGTAAEKIARKHSINTVFLETSAGAIECGIKEARKMIEIARKEKQKTEQAKSILHYITQGVISVDSSSRIVTFNNSAEKMTGLSCEEAIGKSIKDVMPEIDLSGVMASNVPELGQLHRIGRMQVMVNKGPVMIKGNTGGAVATFEDVTIIQEYERQIRAKLLNKGHIAKYSLNDILGESDAIVKMKEKAKRYAAMDSTILIEGKSGTGKEMFAQGVHLASSRRKGPFVAVNCSTIPRDLIESELFGYEEGAFTGARKVGKQGLFVEAHCGTIFLDEIGEVPLELQSRLLRVLQEKEIRPLGSNKIIPVDVRIIAATNRNLLKEVRDNRFRVDLYYRLNILNLMIPTLNERGDDIKLLSRHLLKKKSTRYNKTLTVTDDALNRLYDYHWPGNIRELENIIERLIAMNDSSISSADVDELICENLQNSDEADAESMEAVKKKHILQILSECKGNQTLAAKKLGISRTHLWRILQDR